MAGNNLNNQLKQDADTSGLRRSSLSSVESALDSGFELGIENYRDYPRLVTMKEAICSTQCSIKLSE